MPERRISVLYFSNSLARGGAEEHILTLLRGLDRDRFRPLLACTPEVADRLAGDIPADVPVVPLTLRRPQHLGAARQLARVIRHEHIDVLHSHLFYASFFASPVGWLCRVPLVVETPHVRELWRKGWKGSYLVDRLAGRFVHRYIAVSEANRRYLMEDKRLPGRKIVVIHNGCDVKRFDPRHEAPASMREKLGFGADDPIVLVVGRLEPQKGHTVLIDAFPLIRNEYPTARLVCVGTGALHDDLEHRVKVLGLRGAVRLVGQQPNIPDWLALADVVALPSFYEGLPLAAIETLAAGRAMVATAVDGTPEVVVDNETGLLVPPGDPARIAMAITRLLADPNLRRRLGTAGRAHVLERFNELRQVARTEALYELGMRRRASDGRATTDPVPLAPAGGGR